MFVSAHPADADVPPEFIEQADIILASQHPSGAISMTPQAWPSDPPASPLWVSPYSACYACIGLLNAYFRTGNPAYFNAVKAYIEWHAANLNPDGTIDDYEGNWAAFGPMGTYDSSDSYAALFLVLVRKYYSLHPDFAWLSSLAPALEKVSGAIELTYDASDGLAEATPTFPVKYLMDNSEVRLGYLAGLYLSEVLGDTVQNFNPEHFRTRLAAVGPGLRGFWNSATGAYNIAKFANGTFAVYNPAEWYPSGMANALALSYNLTPRDSVSVALLDRISGDSYDPASPPPDLREYFFLAAALTKFGRTDRAAQIVNGMYDDFSLPSTYALHRGWYLILNSYSENLDLFENALVGVLRDDVIPPSFASLPGSPSPINLVDGQLLPRGVYVIRVRATDEVGVDRVEFHVDGVLLGADATSDAEGVYEFPWDTTTFHSTVRVVAFDASGNSTDIVRTVSVVQAGAPSADDGTGGGCFIRNVLE